MGWYDTNGNDWYKPSSQTGAQARQPAANLPNGNRKTRVIALIVCLCVLIAGIALIAGGFGSDVIDYNADGKPSDWHDYFNKLYGTDAPTATADVRIPLADDRGSLTIKNGSEGASLDFSTIYEKCSPSVVGIKVYNDSESKDYYAWGSGVIASSDGYIITNTHVLDNGDSATVVLSDGSEHEAKLIGFDASSDIAVIKIDTTGLAAAEFASSSTLSVGDSVAAIGNPLSPDLRLTMTRGIVSALNREINYNDTCFYRRFVFNDGLTLRLDRETFSMTSITSVQYLDDNMTLDQDFLPLDYFTLTQRKREYGLTQDFVARGLKKTALTWLGGLFGFYKHNDMYAPVTFGDMGIRSLIEEHRNASNPDYPLSLIHI